MEANGIKNGCWEAIAEQSEAEFLMLGIKAADGCVFAFRVHQVANIMQQGRCYQGGFAAILLDEPCGLERMFEYRNRLAEIDVAATKRQERKKVIEGGKLNCDGILVSHIGRLSRCFGVHGQTQNSESCGNIAPLAAGVNFQ